MQNLWRRRQPKIPTGETPRKIGRQNYKTYEEMSHHHLEAALSKRRSMRQGLQTQGTSTSSYPEGAKRLLEPP